GEPWRRMLEGDPTMPSRVVVYRWRVERPAWDAALKIAFRAGRLARERDRLRARCAGLSDEIGEQIALGDRQSLRRLAEDPQMPCAATLYKWKAMFPDFAWTVADAREFRDCMAAERAYAASPFYEDMRRAIAGMIGGG
uniref:terminase small subunit-like protein n=1 Tax=Phenylobacterium sp. TaxID=1871053 RepID=UPI00286A7370